MLPALKKRASVDANHLKKRAATWREGSTYLAVGSIFASKRLSGQS